MGCPCNFDLFHSVGLFFVAVSTFCNLAQHSVPGISLLESVVSLCCAILFQFLSIDTVETNQTWNFDSEGDNCIDCVHTANDGCSRIGGNVEMDHLYFFV